MRSAIREGETRFKLIILTRFVFGTLVLGMAGSAPEVHAQQIDRSSEVLFQDALNLFSGNLFASAADKFSAHQDRYPGAERSADAMYYEAQSYLALGREEDAIRLLTRFEKRYPVHPFAFGTRLSLGKYFFEERDFAGALSVLSQVLERSPTAAQSALALYWMGESAHQLGQNDEALRYFERVVTDFSRTETAPRAAYAIAYNQVQLGRYDDAASSFERLASRYPGTEFANNIGLALGEVYYEIDDFDRAADEIERQMPNLSSEARDRATFLLAESYNQLRNSERAIINYRYFTEGKPGSPYFVRALYGLAWNYYHEGVHQWAADNFRMVVEANHATLSSESAYYEAVNLKRAEEIPAAIAAFKFFVKHYPDHRLAPHGWFELGVTFYEQRRWREANDTFEYVVRRYPDEEFSGEALTHWGNTSIALGDFDSAHEAFDRAIGLDAASPDLVREVIFQKAWLNYRNRNYEESATEFIRLFSENPSDPSASEFLFWAAESYFQLSDFERAQTLFVRYQRNYPAGKHQVASHYALAWSYFRQSNYSSAIPEFERFLDAYSEDSETATYRSDARLRLADSYFAVKQFSQAVRVYSKMAAEGDDYALYQIGQAYSSAGDPFEAISNFRLLLRTFPASEWREEAQYSLAYLYFLNQEYEQAVSEYEVLINSFPMDPLAAKAQYGIGDAHFNDGNIDLAVRAYQRVLFRYPTSRFAAEAATGIQFALMAAGQEDRADAIIDSLVIALEGSPAAEQLVYRQAEARYQSGRTEEALTDFEGFLESASDPELLGGAHFYIAEIYSSSGDTTRSEAHFQSVVANYSSSTRFTESAGALGHIMLANNRPTEAELLFQRMEDQSAGNPRMISLARYGRSLALQQLSRTDEAEKLLRDSISNGELSDATYPAYLGLARINHERGDISEAERLFDLVASRSRDEAGAEALYLLGMSQIERGLNEAGIETLARMQTLFGGYSRWLAMSYLQQGMAFESLNNRAQAIRLYKIIQSMYPNSSVFNTAEDRLNELQ